MNEQILWDAGNSTEPSKNCENRDANALNAITSDTEPQSTPPVCVDIGPTKKEQKRLYLKQWRQTHKEEIKKYLEANKEKIKDYRDNYRIENKEYFKLKYHEYYSNPEAIEERKLRDKKRNSLPESKAKKKLYDKIYCAENAEKIKQQRIKRAATIEAKVLHWKNSAKSRNIKWDLSKEFIINLPRKCHYTGIDLTLEARQLNTISLERIDSSRDYTEDNVVLCCHMVNIMKSTFGKEDFIKMCKTIAAYNP